jgi:hypothetical protein
LATLLAQRHTVKLGASNMLKLVIIRLPTIASMASTQHAQTDRLCSLKLAATMLPARAQPFSRKQLAALLLAQLPALLGCILHAAKFASRSTSC